MIGKIVAHSSKVYTMASFSETSYSNKNILKTVLFSSEFFHKQRAMSICCLTQTIGAMDYNVINYVPYGPDILSSYKK